MNHMKRLLGLTLSLPITVLLSIILLSGMYSLFLVYQTGPTLAFTLGMLLAAAIIRVIIFVLD